LSCERICDETNTCTRWSREGQRHYLYFVLCVSLSFAFGGWGKNWLIEMSALLLARKKGSGLSVEGGVQRSHLGNPWWETKEMKEMGLRHIVTESTEPRTLRHDKGVPGVLCPPSLTYRVSRRLTVIGHGEASV
jgi:hypothetical protein